MNSRKKQGNDKLPPKARRSRGDAEGERDDDDEEDDRKLPARVVFLGSEEEEDTNNSSNNLHFHTDTDSISTRSTAIPVSAAAATLTTPQNHHRSGSKSNPSGLTAATPGSAMSPSSPAYAAKLASHQELIQSESSLIPLSSSPSMLERILRDDSSRRLLDQLSLWGGTATLSAATLLYTILPSTALVALSVLSWSLMLFMYTVYRAGRTAYRNAVQGQGLGQYLPDSIMRMLTEQSFHEFMSDPTFGLENRHLMLYFLPLSREQLEAAIRQLAPSRQARLYGRMGDMVLGPQYMRLLLGDERYRPPSASGEPVPPGQSETTNALAALDASPSSAAATSTVTTTTSPLRVQRNLLFDDDDSDLGLQIQEQDLAGGLDEHQATRVARSIGLSASVDSTVATTTSRSATTSNNTATRADGGTARDVVPAAPPAPPAISPEQQQVYDDEALVLVNAIAGSAYSSVWSPGVSYLSDWVGQYTRPLLQRVTRYGFGLSLFSSSVGLIGSTWGSLALSTTVTAATTTLFGSSWAIVVPRSLPNRRDHPASHAVWTMAMWSGATAMIALGVQSYWWGRRDGSAGSSSTTTTGMFSLWTSVLGGGAAQHSSAPESSSKPADGAPEKKKNKRD